MLYQVCYYFGMTALREKLHQDIERLNERELRLLEKFVMDLTLSEDEAAPDERTALSNTQQEDDYTLWQPTKSS